MDAALVDQPFLGSRLMSLVGVVATTSADEELLTEIDRYSKFILHYTRQYPLS